MISPVSVRDFTRVGLLELWCVFGLLVVEECKRMLVGAGFTELKEIDTWKIEPGNKV